MADDAVIFVPFAGSMLLVLALLQRSRRLGSRRLGSQGWGSQGLGHVQARGLLTHPVAEQLQKRVFEKDRATSDAVQNCSPRWHRMLLDSLRQVNFRQVKVSRRGAVRRLSNLRHRYPDRELFHGAEDHLVVVEFTN
jgi:hypothetical protein